MVGGREERERGSYECGLYEEKVKLELYLYLLFFFLILTSLFSSSFYFFKFIGHANFKPQIKTNKSGENEILLDRVWWAVGQLQFGNTLF